MLQLAQHVFHFYYQNQYNIIEELTFFELFQFFSFCT